MDYRVGYKEVMMEEQWVDKRISDENTLIHLSQGQRPTAMLVLHYYPTDLYVLFSAFFLCLSVYETIW